MSDKYILDDKHEAIPCDNLLQWARWCENREACRVALTSINNDCEVSTVFLGLDHSFGHGSPVLFESMTFGGPHDGAQERYHTWDEAVAGHAAMVERAQEEAPCTS